MTASNMIDDTYMSWCLMILRKHEPELFRQVKPEKPLILQVLDNYGGGKLNPSKVHVKGCIYRTMEEFREIPKHRLSRKGKSIDEALTDINHELGCTQADTEIYSEQDLLDALSTEKEGVYKAYKPIDRLYPQEIISMAINYLNGEG